MSSTDPKPGDKRRLGRNSVISVVSGWYGTIVVVSVEEEWM